MTKYWLLLFVCFLFACKSNQHKENELIPYKKDINEIIELIVGKKVSSHSKAALISELFRIKILTPGYPPNMPSPVGSIELHRLLNFKINQRNFFDKTDSLHILSQNEMFKTFQIDRTRLKGIKFISMGDALKNMKSEKEVPFYEMMIPVFSSDNKKAYVEWDSSGCGLCGVGTALFLEKINNKWNIVSEENIWVS